ncbi:MAG: tetratricopeptide repeat protein, partial [Burkholderiales bacterium]|nr:tetratricopeptide repeat protein [Anaerolineae bacterium]
MIGRTLGGYRIVEQVGSGGMATIYKAYDPNTERFVALKLLPAQYSQDPMFRERFRREAKAIARLEHIHILPVHAYGEEDGTAYLVMRYLPAGTLSERIRQGMIPLTEISRIIEQLASALDYAHANGVLHRDVKPSNVLLDDRGNTFLTDFGIAKMVEMNLDLTGDSILGTPSYMSPEQCEGRTDLAAATDIYSLGVVLYEMVTGRTPFSAETPLAVIHMQLRGEALPPPNLLRPDLPENAEAVILKALSRKPEERQASCATMATAFSRAVREDTPTASRARVQAAEEAGMGATITGDEALLNPPTTLLPPRRRKFPVWALALISVVVVVAAIGLAWRLMPNTPIVTPTPPAVGAQPTPDNELPTTIPTPATPLAQAVRGLVARSGPGSQYGSIATMEANDRFDIVGISEDGAWYQVTLPDGAQGWIAASAALVNTSGDLSVVPMVAFVPTEAATDIPTDIPTNEPIPTDVPTDSPTDSPTDAPTEVALNTSGDLSAADAESIDLALGDARLAFQEGSYENAVEQYTQVVDMLPDDARAYIGRGNSYMSLGDYYAAIVDYAQAIELEPQNFDAVYNRGYAYLLLGENEAALQDLTQSIALDPSSAPAYSRRAEAYSGLGDDSAALDDYAMSLSIDPTNANVLNERGELFISSGDYEQAVDELSLAVEIEPTFAIAYANRGYAYSVLENNDAALQDFNAAVEIDPTFIEAWFGRGYVQLTREDYEAAISDFTQTLELDGDYVDALVYRARAYASLENNDAAIEDYSAAIELDPGSFEAFYQRGRLYAEDENYDAAIEDFTRAIEIDPSCDCAYSDRAYAYVELGDNDAAIDDFSLALALNPNADYLHWGLADALYEVERYEEALTFYRSYVDLTGDSADSFVVDRIAELEANGTIADAAETAPDVVVASAENGTLLSISGTGVSVDQPAFSLPGPMGSAVRLAFSPDGTRLATGGDYQDMQVRIWDMTALSSDAENTALLTLDNGQSVTDVAFSPDGTLLYSGGPQLIWDLNTGESVASLENPRNDIWTSTLALSPDGSLLAVGGGDGSIAVWSTSQRELLGQLNTDSEDGTIYSVAFHPDGVRLASSSESGIVRLWNAASSQQISEMQLPDAGDLTFSYDGGVLAAIATNGVWVFNGVNGDLIGLVEDVVDGAPVSIAFSPDNELMAVGYTGGAAQLLKLGVDPIALVATLQANEETVQSLTFSPDNAYLAAAQDDGVVRLWEIAPLIASEFSNAEINSVSQTLSEPVLTLSGHSSALRVAFNADGTQLASSGDYEDTSILVWDMASGAQVAEFDNGNSLSDIAFTPDGEQIISADPLRLWSIADSDTEAVDLENPIWIASMALSPDGTMIAAGSGEGPIFLWDTAARQIIAELDGHESSVNDLEFSTDGTHLISGSNDGSVRVWDVATNEQVDEQTIPNSVNSVALTPDGTTVAISSYPGVWLWNIDAGEPLAFIPNGTYGVPVEILFNPENPNLLANGSTDGTVRLFDISAVLNGDLSVDEVLIIESNSIGAEVRGIAFSPDGTRLAAAVTDGSVSVWDVGSFLSESSTAADSEGD